MVLPGKLPKGVFLDVSLLSHAVVGIEKIRVLSQDLLDLLLGPDVKRPFDMFLRIFVTDGAIRILSRVEPSIFPRHVAQHVPEDPTRHRLKEGIPADLIGVQIGHRQL